MHGGLDREMVAAEAALADPEVFFGMPLGSGGQHAGIHLSPRPARSTGRLPAAEDQFINGAQSSVPRLQKIR